MGAGLEGPLGPEAEPLQGLKPLNSGRNQSSLTAPLGRGWPAAGVVISRCRTDEGLLPRNPKTRSVLEVIKAGNSDSKSWPGNAKFNLGIPV
jgi:hypothetical protein